MSVEDRLREAEQHELKKRAFDREVAGRDLGRAGRDEAGPLQGAAMGMVGTCLADDGAASRRWLEHLRDQRRREADEIQVLLDVLPAKIPPAAASALQRLLFK